MIEFDDEKVKRIFNEAGLKVEKREQSLTDEELDKQVKEIMSCFEEVQNESRSAVYSAKRRIL